MGVKGTRGSTFVSLYGLCKSNHCFLMIPASISITNIVNYVVFLFSRCHAYSAWWLSNILGIFFANHSFTIMCLMIFQKINITTFIFYQTKEILQIMFFSIPKGQSDLEDENFLFCRYHAYSAWWLHNPMDIFMQLIFLQSCDFVNIL